MKITFHLITDLANEQGTIVKSFNVNTRLPHRAQATVIARLTETAKALFGPNIAVRADQSIWGGYFYDKSNGNALIAR